MRKVKTLRHDADHCARQSVEGDGLSQNMGIAAQLVSPEGIAHYRDLRRIRSLFFSGEIPSHQRPRSHHSEERNRNGRGIQLLGSLHSGPVHGHRAERGDIFEDPVLFTECVVVRRGADIQVSGAGPLADPVDALGVRIQKRADENGVCDAEDSCVRTDAGR